MRKLALVLALVGLGACTAEHPAMSFVALGDAPYGKPEEVFPPYKSLIENVNAAKPGLVVHIGDTHGHYTCDNALMDQLRGFMDDFDAPVLYTPGDNEWTDCGSTEEGSFDPLERLSYLRKTYFKGGMSLGAKPEKVQNQARKGYPENARLMKGNVGFVTVHVVGSNNNFSPSDPAAADEFFARNTANVAWLEESFAKFKDADAIVVALHADMFVPLSGFREGWHPMSPFRDIGITLGKQSSALEKPVLLLYGDSHVHKVFQPFAKYRPFLHAIEVYGYPDIKAIEVGVRPNAKKPFQVERVFNP
ncbi:MAG: hypothetical protein AB8B60_17835 [Sulfitobacter sp.]